MQFSLGKKLILGGIALVTVPLVIVGSFTLYRATQGVEGLAEGGARAVAQGLADMTQLVMQEEVKIAQGLAQTVLTREATAKLAKEGPEAAKALATQLDRFLTDFQKASGQDYESIFVTGPDGKIYTDSVAGKVKGFDMADRAYIKQAMTGQANAFQVVRSKLSNLPVAMVGAPVTDASGKVLGVFGMTLNIKFLMDKISAAKLGERGYAYLLDADGLTIAHRDAKLILEANIHQTPGMEGLVAKFKANPSGAERYDFRGVAKVCGYATVPLNGWRVVATQDRDDFMSDINHIQIGFWLVGGVSLLAAVLLLLWFGRGISRPITLSADGLGEAAEQVTVAAGQVSASSQSLAQGTSEQAAALEETSSSLEELSSMTKNNADHASQANALTGESTRAMEGVGRNMAELTRSMQEISQASQETSKIIKTIDEIAFQTNLLALNAAVEAARAGEAGAGFAVVADEVRNLAMRAAEAAKNTAGLIEGTVEKVKGGASLVSQTDEAFRQMSQGVAKVAELVGEIAAASVEQAQGIEQINKAATELDKVTQRAAASAEETAAAAEEMTGQAESMHGFVASLRKVVHGGAGETPAAAPARRPERRAAALLPGPAKAKASKAPARPAPAAPAAKTRSQGKRPEEVLPLDDADFKNF